MGLRKFRGIEKFSGGSRDILGVGGWIEKFSGGGGVEKFSRGGKLRNF